MGEIARLPLNTREILLCLLLNGPMAGYDIKKALDGDIAGVLDIRISNLYPLLNELADSGLVQFVRVEQTSRPNKKVYCLTEAGRKLCLDALLHCRIRQKFRSELLFPLQFACLLPASHIDRLLDDRLSELRGYLDELARSSVPTAAAYHKFKIGLARAMIEAELEYIVSERHLLTADPRSRKRRSCNTA
ncbi:PadR family transcriptional regulator [Parvibaculum sedimenti]|nr:PadR family transcriptional regulator [Parvibaculum sedimenti]